MKKDLDPYDAARIRRLKQRITNTIWELPKATRNKINEAIDAWAAAENKRR